MARWRMPLRWWAATLSPLAFLAVALAVAAAIGKLPRGSGFGRYSGLPAIGVVPVAVIAILITFGEETGWRGFALPLLQRRYGALAAALLVTPIWALWHLPYFFTVTTYRGFAPVGYVGFVFGLACGSIVLTWLYNGRRQHPRLRDLARPLQPRNRHRRGHQHDPGGHQRLRLRPGVPARRVRTARAQAGRTVDPRPPPRRGPPPALQRDPPLINCSASMRRRERRWASAPPRSPCEPAGIGRGRFRRRHCPRQP